MTREEAKKLVFIVAHSYPNFKPLDLKTTIDVWYDMLQDQKYNEVAVALKSYIKSDCSGFAPSIGQLLNELRKIKTTVCSKKELTEQEAWNLTYRAICNSNYNSLEEFMKLPKIVQEAVGDPAILKEWASTPIDDIQSVIASNFMRTYRSIVNKHETESRIPKDVLIAMKTDQLRLED